MNWNAIFGIASFTTFLFPVSVIARYRLYEQRSLTALSFSYIFSAILVLMNIGLIPVSETLNISYYTFVKYLDVPLMLTAMLFFCPSKQKQYKIQLLTVAVLLYETVIGIINGFRPVSVGYVLGPGLIIILAYSFFLFGRQAKFTIMHSKNAGRTIMLAAVVFAYSGNGLIYYFEYIQKTPHKEDTQLLFYLFSTLATILMGLGLLLTRKRIRELQTLRITRKELALFFGH
jgi:hypothetical protein